MSRLPGVPCIYVRVCIYILVLEVALGLVLAGQVLMLCPQHACVFTFQSQSPSQESALLRLRLFEITASH